MDINLLRGLERILVVVFAGLAIYLGYRLFLDLPKQRPGEGKVDLPGGISIYISRIGPGAFFCLFGTIVLSLSYVFGVKYSTENGSKVYQGFSQNQVFTDSNSQQKQFERVDVKDNIFFLNNLLPLMEPHLSLEKRADVSIAVQEIKLRLIEVIWADDWGDYQRFRKLIEEGHSIPEAYKQPIEFYNYGSEGHEK